MSKFKDIRIEYLTAVLREIRLVSEDELIIEIINNAIERMGIDDKIEKKIEKKITEYE